MSDLCLCGHPQLTHLNDSEGRRGRGKCSGTRRLWLRPPPKSVKGPTDDVLDAKRAEKLFEHHRAKALKHPNYQSKFAKLYARGYLNVDCTCPTYHLVDLGQVSIIKPGG